MKHYFLTIISILFVSTTSFAESAHKDYFDAVKKIQQIPSGATPILECNLKEEKNIIELLSQNEIHSIFGGKPKIHTSIMDNYGDNIKIYRGDFSNSGNTEYLFLAQGGSLGTDDVIKVYQLKNNHLVDLNFNETVVNNLLPEKDMSSFYMWMPEPFAFVKNHKTYLRFMDYPPRGEYNKAKLLVCTYVWEGKKFNLVGTKNCIG